MNPNGLGSVTCDSKRYAVHILIATLFVERPEGARYVRHRNGDRSDNSATNLQWITTAVRFGPTDDQIALVLAMHQHFRMSHGDIAKRTALSVWQVSQIIRKLDVTAQRP